MRRRLERLATGSLTLRDADGEHPLGDPDAPADLTARVTVHDDAFWGDLAARGVLGAGEAYVLERWSADDLVRVVRILLRNRQVLTELDRGWARLSRPLLRLYHAVRENTRRGSRRNIAAHYDLGNDFFALFLDETMTYSSGIFEHAEATLRDAQTAKLDRLCRKLAVEPAHRVLEIGCGWGSFALHAAGRYGCRVTATTISEAQHEHARNAVRRAGLTDRVEVIREDYRDLKGTYDRVVSIEMIEAVGHRYLDAYVRTVSDRLASDGMAALQAITIADQHYDRARRTVDFIKRYVFPGSFIPSLAAIAGAVARSGDLRIVHLEDIGPHYATTLRHWRECLLGRSDAVRAQGHDEAFLRLWEYYFAYCEAGFQERFLGDLQILLAKPGCRLPPLLPPLA